jgi:branched-chain amino acid transport system ATP-binding protein
MLAIRAIDAFHGNVQVLHGVTLEAHAGEILCLFGRNGAGKSSLLKAVMGLLPVRTGDVLLNGEVISQLPAHRVPGRGIGYVPQGRRLFAELTVEENLEIGLMTRGRGRAVRDQVLDLFPPLGPRLAQRAGTLSGGEQQMLAIGRALCLEPAVLLLDEPTEGLMPTMVARIREVIMALKTGGVTILLVEQRVDAVLSIADRISFIENGRHRETHHAETLRADPAAIHRYVGVSGI